MSSLMNPRRVTTRPVAARVARVGRFALTLTAAILGACAATPPTVPPMLTAAQIEAIVAAPDRSSADRVNDARRKPAEMLAFIGVRPGMVALDLSAGGGYTTELLARAAGPTGRVYGQSRPRDASRPAPARTSAMALAERAKKPAAASIAAVERPFESPAPPGLEADAFDVVTIMFDYHDLGSMGVDRARMNAAVFAALRHGGVYVVADHAGRPGTGISESNTTHRIEEAFLKREIEAAGFRVAAEGLFLRNPNDPRDRETPEPPQPKDEIVLKFVKP